LCLLGGQVHPAEEDYLQEGGDPHQHSGVAARLYAAGLLRVEGPHHVLGEEEGPLRVGGLPSVRGAAHVHLSGAVLVHLSGAARVHLSGAVHARLSAAALALLLRAALTLHVHPHLENVLPPPRDAE